MEVVAPTRYWEIKRESVAQKLSVHIRDLQLDCVLTDSKNEAAAKAWMGQNVDTNSPKIPILGLSIKCSLNGERIVSFSTKAGQCLIIIVWRREVVCEWLSNVLATERIILGGFTREMGKASDLGLQTFMKLRIHKCIAKKERQALRLRQKKLGFGTIAKTLKMEMIISDKPTLFENIDAGAITNDQISICCQHAYMLAQLADKKNSVMMRERILEKNRARRLKDRSKRREREEKNEMEGTDS